MRIKAGDQEYTFDGERMLNVEIMAIEKATNLTAAEWQDALSRGSMLAATALVWVIRKREEPTLAFDQVEFPAATLEIDLSDDEGKDSPDGTESGSRTSSTTTSSPSPDSSESSPGS